MTERCPKCRMPINAEPQEYCARIAELERELSVVKESLTASERQLEEAKAENVKAWNLVQTSNQITIRERALQAERDAARSQLTKLGERLAELEKECSDADSYLQDARLQLEGKERQLREAQSSVLALREALICELGQGKCSRCHGDNFPDLDIHAKALSDTSATAQQVRAKVAELEAKLAEAQGALVAAWDAWNRHSLFMPEFATKLAREVRIEARKKGAEHDE